MQILQEAISVAFKNQYLTFAVMILLLAPVAMVASIENKALQSIQNHFLHKKYYRFSTSVTPRCNMKID